MASLTQWTWVWVNSGGWWCTGRPGVLRFMGSQRVGHDSATDLIWSDLMPNLWGPTTSQNPPRWNPSWLSDVQATSKDPESSNMGQMGWLATDKLATNPITISPRLQVMWQTFSWVLIPHCSPPRCPFPIKSLALSALVSPQTIHFRVLDKSPLSGPRRGSLFCNRLRNFLRKT